MTQHLTQRRSLPLFVLLLAASSLAVASDAGRELRVCADPDNLPFSNKRLEGFENKIAQVIGEDLHASVQYVWFSQGRTFVRETLNAGKCDVLIGAPAEWGQVLTTKPYYASTYVFVYSKDKHSNLSSFDDPALGKLKIGLPLISGEGANPPPAYALARRGLARNVIGYPVFTPSKIIDAVTSGEIDVAVVWGPFGGYFAKQQPVRLSVTPVSVTDDDSSLRFTYEISMGVRRRDTAFKEELERVLDRRQKEIRKVLESYGIPIVSSPSGDSMSANSIH